MNDDRTDDQIQQDVLEELRWDARVAPNEIAVRVKHGIVTLYGNVDLYYKKSAAEQAALRVRGVAAVANELRLELPVTSERSDDQIAAAAAQAIAFDAMLPAKDLKITVSDGWVTLGGEVEWNFQKEDAERLVHRLWGVMGVTNAITVRAKPTPDELKAKIEQALVRSAELDAKKITVEVEGSKAVLTGTVRSWAEREEAERTAWVAPGITYVDDQIQVLPIA